MTSSALTHLFFLSDRPTAGIYTLSLHDALPICGRRSAASRQRWRRGVRGDAGRSRSLVASAHAARRCQEIEEHTSELQSHHDLVCRLLLEKKKTTSRVAAVVAENTSHRTHPATD